MSNSELSGRNQPIYRKEITYRPIASDAPDNRIAGRRSPQQPRIEIIPAEIEVAPRSSGVSLSTLALVNHSEQSLKLEFPQNLVDSSLKSYQFIPAHVKLKPKQKQRVILKQIHVRGVSYKGLAFKATVTDDSGFQQVLAINTKPWDHPGEAP